MLHNNNNNNNRYKLILRDEINIRIYLNLFSVF